MLLLKNRKGRYSKSMAKAKSPKETDQTDNGEVETVEETETAPVQATATPQDVTVPVEGATPVEGGATTPKVVKPDVPEHLKKGNRVCASCGTTEADFLAKNPRYSLCQGVDVLCYRKGDRVIYGQTLEEVKAKYPDKAGKDNDKGQPQISAVSGIGIKPGILVRGAIKYSRKATATEGATPTPADTAATATPVEATPVSTATSEAGAAGTTSAG